LVNSISLNMKSLNPILLILTGFLLMAAAGCSKYKSTVEVVGTPGGTAKDADGNEYHTVITGTQTWFAENLMTTKYNDGIPIQNFGSDANWSSLISGAYCWYDNDAAAYQAKYGALYNWQAVATGKLCPTGWHVPAAAEWATLNFFLNGSVVAGGKMKTTTGWKINRGATNGSGFNALPGGYRDAYRFFDLGTNGFWWSSSEYNVQTEYNFLYAFGLTINYYENRTATSEFPKESGFSVRCLKD
jgi:uncharacterized protein (TIGR02145 family)